jgi:hypothetical protein
MRFLRSGKNHEDHRKFLHILWSEDTDFITAKEKIKAHLKFHKGDREEYLITLFPESPKIN